MSLPSFFKNYYISLTRAVISVNESDRQHHSFYAGTAKRKTKRKKFNPQLLLPFIVYLCSQFLMYSDQ